MNSATTLSATGSVITGTVTYNSTGATALGTTDNTIKLGSNPGDFALIANPYWSSVDFNLLTKTDIFPTYWIWDPSIGNRGAYVSYSSSTGLSSGGNITKDIQAGQAIFIQNKDVANGFGYSPSIVFNEANKSTGVTNTFRTANQTPSKLTIQLYENEALRTGGNMQDGVVAAFRNDFTSAVGDEDASKFTNTDENIAIVRGNYVLGVEGRSTVTANDTIPIRLWKLFASNQYTLKLEGLDFDAGIQATLHDKFLDKMTDVNVSGSTTYPFTFTNTDSASFYNRFEVVLHTAQLLPVTITNIRAYRQHEGVLVEWTNETETGIARYEVEKSTDGRLFAKAASIAAANNQNTAASYSWLDVNMSSGYNYYRVKTIENSGEIKYTSIVKVNAGSEGLMVRVYPNPIRGTEFNLQMTNVVTGNYTVSIYNKLGQPIYQQQHSTQGSSVSEIVKMKQRPPAGIYTLVIRAEKGNVYQQKLVFSN